MATFSVVSPALFSYYYSAQIEMSAHTVLVNSCQECFVTRCTLLGCSLQ